MAENARNEAVPSIDGYVDFRLIGVGGYSKVYAAQQVEFNRRVAVKVLTIDEARPFDRSAFEGECRSMGTVSNHPNIVTIFESGFTDQQQPYLTMELYRETLFDRIRESGTLSPADAADLGERLALALERAHADGVVHCDVKPQNVFFSEYGEPALGDFGIAAVDREETGTLEARGLTPNYAAPEVLTGGAPSVSTDLYALGATLYTSLAGHHPYRNLGEGDDTVESRVLSGESPEPIESQEIPPVLNQFIARMMAHDPSDRPQSSTAVALELSALQRDEDLGSVSPGRSSRNLVDADPDDSPTIVRSASAGTATGIFGMGSFLAIAAVLLAVMAGVVLLVRASDSPEEVATNASGSNEEAIVGSAGDPATGAETAVATTTTVMPATTTTIAEPELLNLLVGSEVVELGCSYNQTHETGLVSIDEPTFDGMAVSLGGENVALGAHVELRIREVDLNVYWNGRSWERTAESFFVTVSESWQYDLGLPDGRYCVIARGRDRSNGAIDRGQTIAFAIVGSSSDAIVPGTTEPNTANLIGTPPNGSHLYADSPQWVKLKEGTTSFEITGENDAIAIPADQLELLLANERVTLSLEPGSYEFRANGADNTRDIHVVTVLDVPEGN